VPGIAQRGEDQHRRGDPLAAQPGEQVDAVEYGQAPVEHDDVVRPGQAQVQAALAVGGDVDRVPLGGEQLGEHAAQVGVVLDQQQARCGGGRHPVIIAGRPGSACRG
jgi:hypothetical protein